MGKIEIDVIMDSVFFYASRTSHHGQYRKLYLSSVFLLVFAFIAGCAGNTSLIEYEIDGTKNQALIFKPEGTGPFSTVIYNHGMVVDLYGLQGASAKGYKLAEICKALADNGYFVFAPIRQSGQGNIPSHKREVDQAIDYVKKLPDVDPSRIGLMGFSRGGLLTLMVALERSDLKALVILAPAPGRGHFAGAVRRVSSINAPVLLSVEMSDSQVILEDFEMLSRSLKELGKESRIMKYNSGGGHRLFYKVGYYWDDVLRFLKDNL